MTGTAQHIPEIITPRAVTARLFLILPPDQVPDNALTWRNPKQKADLLRAWRRAICTTFPESSRVIRMAWLLDELFHAKGYAFASDGHLARETGMAVNKVQDALLSLHKGGAIVRVHVAGKLEERRIYPLRTLLLGTPHGGVSAAPQHPGVQNRKVTAGFRKTQTMRDAQRWAERRRTSE